MFDLNQQVEIVASGETGKVIGKAQFTYCDDEYLVRYKAADGRCVQNWWTESALKAVSK